MLLKLLLVIGAVAQGIPGGYAADIEYTINIPDKDVKSFNRTNGADPFYKILTRNARGMLYIGGREELLILNASTLLEPKKVAVPTNEIRGKSDLRCSDFTKPTEVDKLCKNYIRVADNIDDGTILVCGTNSLDAMCRFVDITDGEYILRNGSRLDADKKIQSALPQNSTAIYNQANGQLFVGHSESLQPNPAHISKFSVSASSLTTLAQSEDQNENLINEPDFVGKPFIYKGFIYFFYRETAVEVVNQGKFIYSRVGRVCENDTSSDLFTFFKARLNCSLLGDFAFYFDYIQDVIVDVDSSGKPIFYAVFTTTPHGPPSSAVCSYRIDDIIEVFENSRFKGKKATGKLPGPVNRPTFANKFLECAASFTSEEQSFQRSNTLMDEMVPNYNPDDQTSNASDPPLFYSTEMNLYSIAHDREHNINYVGTEHGTILRAVRQDGGGWKVYEQELSEVKHPVTGLHYSSDAQALLVVNQRGLYRLHVGACTAYCSFECDGFYKGYCHTVDGSCVSSDTDIPTPVSTPLRNVDVRILSKINSTIMSCPSRRVELTCEVRGSQPCGEVSLEWKFGSEVLISCSGGKSCEGGLSTKAPFIQYLEISSHPYYKLVHLSVDVYNEHTVGNFTCEGKEDGNANADTNVDSVEIKASSEPGCLTKETYRKRNETHAKLMEEYNALITTRQGDGDMPSSDAIMFQTCDQCPGDVQINRN